MQALKNKDVIQSSCPHIEGARIPDLLNFIRDQKLAEYLPGRNSRGKELKYDRDWLLGVSSHAPFNIIITAAEHVTSYRCIQKDAIGSPSCKERKVFEETPCRSFYHKRNCGFPQKYFVNRMKTIYFHRLNDCCSGEG